MRNDDIYQKDLFVENFLRRALELKMGTPSYEKFRGKYAALEHYEGGEASYLGPKSRHEQRVASMKKHIEKAINKLEKSTE